MYSIGNTSTEYLNYWVGYKKANFWYTCKEIKNWRTKKETHISSSYGSLRKGNKFWHPQKEDRHTCSLSSYCSHTVLNFLVISRLSSLSFEFFSLFCCITAVSSFSVLWNLADTSFRFSSSSRIFSTLSSCTISFLLNETS